MRFWIIAFATLAWPAIAHAYPQWQLSSGAVRCDQCHVAPGGGGLLSGRGREIVGDELSTFFGDGALLHGAAKLPRWLEVGADARGAYLTQGAPSANESPQAALPVRADAQGFVSIEQVSIYGTVGVRGQLNSDSMVVPLQNYQPARASWLVASEHWIIWRPQSEGPYVRAGRFFAPFGLRLAEHVTYIRRDLGFGEMEESYNLSAGYVSDRWEAHATAFAPDFVRHFGSNETGAAAYVERRTRHGAGAFALQAKYASSPGLERAIGGAVGKYYVAPIKTLFFAEADFVRLAVDGIAARGQAIAAAGAAVLPFRGVMVTALGEHYQEDVQVRGAARSAATLLLGWFPYAHLEAQLMARAEIPSGGTDTRLLFAQLHYSL